MDPIRPVAEICRQHGVWLHVDAAFAGSALILPECRLLSDGIELADSVVMNPHKWLMTNFDCSAYFVRDTDALVRTFSILPEYLRTKEDDRVNNYRDWGIPLGRRFRALKLWFVIRSYGVEGLRQIIRGHIRMAQALAEEIRGTPDFEVLAPVPLSLVCFRYRPAGVPEGEELNAMNARLLESLNATGRIFLTHTMLRGTYSLRLVVGQLRARDRHVEEAWSLIREHARTLA
jgi:aromatic-L-amino-acid decarboxylase